MKMRNLSKCSYFLMIAYLWSSVTVAGNIGYSELKMKDYDEMRAEVYKHVSMAENYGDDNQDQAKKALQYALLVILSRPNSDNMVSKLIPMARTPLKNIEAYETVLDNIVSHAIKSAKNPSAKTSVGATSLIILENFMSETRPEIPNNPKIKKIFEGIRDAKIKVSNKVTVEMKMRAMMKEGFTPSETAQKILGNPKK